MTTIAATTTSATAAAASTPTTADRIHAIRTIQAQQAAKIGDACVALANSKTPLVIADFATEVEILAGLDLAVAVLQAGV